METNNNEAVAENTYSIGNSNYEVTRIFSEEKSVKDILLESISGGKTSSHN